MSELDKENLVKQENAENVVQVPISADKPLISDEKEVTEAAIAKKNPAPKPWFESKKRKLKIVEFVSRYEFLTQILVLLVTAIARAVAVNMFANPNKLSLGGITGIGTILYNALGWPVSVTTLIMNAPLLILAFFLINKRFAFLTFISTLLSSFFFQYFDFFPPFANDPFVAALMSGAITGFAIGLMLKVNCSTGGTDIMGLLIQNKFPNSKVVWIIFVLNAITGIVAGIVFKSLPIAIYSFIAIITSSYATDLLQRGFVSTFEVKVITSKPEVISDYVINVLHRSASLMKTTGMYSHAEHDYLICIIRKRQLPEFKRAIKMIDENAFIYITSIYDIIGKSFNNSVTPKSKIK